MVQVEDRQVEPAIKLMLDPFNLRVTGYSTAPGTTIGIVTDTRIDKAASLEADLQYALDDGKLEGTAKLADFDLTVIQPYLDRYTKMDLLSGSLDERPRGDAPRRRRLRGERNRAGGQASLRGQGTAGGLHQVAARARRGLQLRRPHRGAPHQDARMRSPYARVIIAKDETINVVEIMTPDKPAPAYQPSVQLATAEGPPPQETQVRIDTVAIEDGSLNFADFWIQPNYAVSVQQLNGSVIGLSSDETSRAKLELEGKVDRYAPATINGEMNLLSATLYTDIRLKFAGVDMTSVTPYSGRFAGYKIEKGKLSIDVTYKVENRALDAKQKFVIDQLQLGEKVESPDAVSLPLKLAVALLKDRNGVIDIDLPMTGSLDDPKFRLGPLIWKAFVGLLTKIATAPFALIGSLFGGGPEVNFVEFDPGAILLDPSGQEKMATVKKALVERPALQVDVPMAYSAELDGGLIERQALDASLTKLAASQRKLLGGRPERGGGGSDARRPRRAFRASREALPRGGGRRGAAPRRCRRDRSAQEEGADARGTGGGQQVDRGRLARQASGHDRTDGRLGKARGQSIQEALLGGGEVDPARVFLIHADSQAPDGGKVKLELSLK